MLKLLIWSIVALAAVTIIIGVLRTGTAAGEGDAQEDSSGVSIASAPPRVRAGGRKMFDIRFFTDPKSKSSSASNLRGEEPAAGHKPLQFLSAEDLKGHTKTEHKEAVSDGNAAARNEKSKRHQSIEFLTEEEQQKHKPEGGSNIHFGSGKRVGATVSSSTGAGSTADAGEGGRTRSPKSSKNTVDLHEITIENPHPLYSPHLGSDISPHNHMALLTCPNQSKCVVPELQLKRKYKIYFCSHPSRMGVRYYYLAREGFLLHPNVEMLPFDRVEEADFIVYLPGSAPWHLTECNRTSFGPRMMILDEFDGHSLVEPTISDEEYERAYGGLNKQWYFIYFKRSFVRRLDGEFRGYPHLHQPDVYPMVYAIAEAYVQMHFNFKREIEVLCTLRGHTRMPTRQRTQNFVAEYGFSRKLKNFVAGEVSSSCCSIGCCLLFAVCC